VKLSIIIPTFNEEKHLPQLLNQIRGQTFKDYEVIIADGGSTDFTLKIAREDNCKIAKGGSPAKGRNHGASISQGELLLFTDADNVSLPHNFLERIIQKFEKKRLGVASFPIFPQGNFVDKVAYFLYNLWAGLSQKFLAHATNTILVKRSIHQEIGGFDEEIRLAEDHEYVRRAVKHGKFGFIQEGPILTSARRQEREGRATLYLKYLLAAAYLLFLGPIKSDIFDYRLGKGLERGKKDRL
jgi:glycosyltransferase involved in cell wall biosynthesis